MDLKNHLDRRLGSQPHIAADGKINHPQEAIDELYRRYFLLHFAADFPLR